MCDTREIEIIFWKGLLKSVDNILDSQQSDKLVSETIEDYGRYCEIYIKVSQKIKEDIRNHIDNLDNYDDTENKIDALSYPVEISTADDGITVIFPDFPFGATHGNTYQEATKNAKDCLEEMIAMLFNEGAIIPIPSKHESLPKIKLSLEMSEKVRKYNDSLGGD